FAMNPATGAVLVMASSPAYNPNLIEKHYQQALRSGGKCGPLLNRATAGKYQPGSSFKVVTATAALNSGRFTPDSSFYDPGYCEEYGKQVRNAGNPEAPETFGNVSLFTGLQHSINSVFCNVGKAMVAGTVANTGLEMKPYRVQRVVAPGGKTIVNTKPRKLSRVMRPEIASEINSMMQAVVTGGTGTAAAISGVPVAGKTGTAETGVGNIYTAWFIAFAPADHPRVAIAVVVENQAGGFGGKVSAPIARDVMEALLR